MDLVTWLIVGLVAGVLASVVAQLMMGNESVSPYQRRTDQPTLGTTYDDP